MNSLIMLNKDVIQIIFNTLSVPEKYNFYLYCKENNLTEDLVYIERYFQSLYNISTDKWRSIIINNKHQLHYDFINKYKDEIDWHMLSIYQTFTPDFFKKFSTYIDWETASSYQRFTINILEKFKYYINWDLVSSRNDFLTPEMLEIFSEQIKWNYVNITDFSDNFLDKYKDKINWSNVTFTNIDRYEDYIEYLDWVKLSYSKDLSEDFMRKYQDLLDWDLLSSHQEMSKDFIKEFSDRVNMNSRIFFNDRHNRRDNMIIRLPFNPPPLTRQSRLRNLF